MSAQTAADLRAAADLLERAGWIQHAMGGPGRGRCALGALGVVTQGINWSSLRWNDPRSIRLDKAVDALVAHTGKPVPVWNDLPGLTPAEVVKTLRQVADEEDFQ